MEGMLARSKAGHDKGRVYLAFFSEDGMVELVNGAGRTLEHPKRKKRIHVQPITHLPDEVKELMDGLTEYTDEAVVKILDAYARRS